MRPENLTDEDVAGFKAAGLPPPPAHAVFYTALNSRNWWVEIPPPDEHTPSTTFRWEHALNVGQRPGGLYRLTAMAPVQMKRGHWIKSALYPNEIRAALEKHGLANRQTIPG